MKILLSLLVAAAAVVAVAGAILVTPASGGGAVPFHATFQFTAAPAADSAPCADSELRFDVVGSGVATHLGRFETVQYHCTPLSDLTAFAGKYTFSGANGDTIYGTYAGHFVPIPGSPEFRPDAHFTIDGGTGRFTGATGGGPVTGHALPSGGVVILDGTITSVGTLKH
ncbi:MAG: hypothetical protein ACXVZ3_02420 [Gaiellaceae bacterium]